jgi:hypothetical protein
MAIVEPVMIKDSRRRCSVKHQSYYETLLESGLFVLRWRLLFHGGAVHITAAASLRHVPDELPAAPRECAGGS